jgi:hypothetical protein
MRPQSCFYEPPGHFDGARSVHAAFHGASPLAGLAAIERLHVSRTTDAAATASSLRRTAVVDDLLHLGAPQPTGALRGH